MVPGPGRVPLLGVPRVAPPIASHRDAHGGTNGERGDRGGVRTAVSHPRGRGTSGGGAFGRGAGAVERRFGRGTGGSALEASRRAAEFAGRADRQRPRDHAHDGGAAVKAAARADGRARSRPRRGRGAESRGGDDQGALRTRSCVTRGVVRARTG